MRFYTASGKMLSACNILALLFYKNTHIDPSGVNASKVPDDIRLRTFHGLRCTVTHRATTPKTTERTKAGGSKQLPSIPKDYLDPDQMEPRLPMPFRMIDR
jgi:hypothetical protein